MRERFVGQVLSGHKELAVEVPFDPRERWQSTARSLRKGRRGHLVRCKLNGAKFESAIVARSRRFFVLVPVDFVVAESLGAGDTVKVELEPVDGDIAGSVG